MAVHLGLGMNLLPPPSTDARILAGVFGRSYATGKDGTIAQSGGTGGSFLCPWTNTVIASGGICGFTLPVPGGGSVRFCHTQGQRINLFLNSNAPATQNVTVGTGSVTISAIGSGYTLVSSAGTATATGYGAVTMGTPQVLTVTVAGTITLTVTGTPVGGYVNVEQAAFPGVKIITAGASVTRTADSILWTPPAALSTTSGELVALGLAYGWSAAATAAAPDAANKPLFNIPGTGNNFLTREAGQWLLNLADAGGNQAVGSASNAVTAGTMVMLSADYDTALRLYSGTTLLGTDATVSAPWNTHNAGINLGEYGSIKFYGAVGYIFTPGGLTSGERAALARYFNAKVITNYG